MEQKRCLLTIKKLYEQLTAAEKAVADYILQHSEAVITMPVAELSGEAGVAKSAVIRCCKSLGFEGYAELKIALAMELSKNKKLNYSPYIDAQDRADEILDKVFSSNVKTLHDTAEKIDRLMLQKVVDLLGEADMIYIYAVGTSAGLANEFQYRLMQIGKKAICITDVTYMKVSTLNLGKKDVAVGISHSGRTIPTVEALRAAHDSGIRTVCITSYHSSALAEVCDYSIEVFSDEIDYPMEAISSRIAHLSVIDVIAIAISAKEYEVAAERSKRTHELVNTLRV